MVVSWLYDFILFVIISVVMIVRLLVVLSVELLLLLMMILIFLLIIIIWCLFIMIHGSPSLALVFGNFKSLPLWWRYSYPLIIIVNVVIWLLMMVAKYRCTERVGCGIMRMILLLDVVINPTWLLLLMFIHIFK